MELIFMHLTIQEEIVVTVLWRLDQEAYGVSIRKKIAEVTGKKMMYGTLYNILNQLLRKGYVEKIKGEPTAKRGGRSKMYYSLTSQGFEMMQKTRELHRSLWDGIPDFKG